MSFRFAYLPLTVATLTFIAFGLGIFFRGLDQLLFAPALLCILLAAFILLIGGLRRGWSLPAGDSAVFLALFWAWLVIALSWSQVAQVSTVFTLLLGAMPLLFFSVLQHPRHGDISRWYSASLSLALGLLGVWALIQFFVLLDLAGTRIRHPMLNPNNLAVLLAMGFFMALAFFVRLQGWRMVLWGALACVLACALLTTQSRGGTLGFFTGIVLLAVFNRGFFVQNWRRMAVLFVSAAAGWIIILSVMSEKFEQVRVFGGEKAMASISERFMLFDSGIRMLLDRPIFGAGLGNFYFLFPSYRNFDDTSDGFFLHVDPLQFAIETGFPVLFIFYGFCLAVLLTTIKAIRKSDAGSQNRMMLMLPFAALVCLLINAHVNFDLYMLPALMLASACLIHWYAASEAILGPKRILVHKDRKLLHIPILLFILAAFVIAPVWLARDAASIYFSGKASVALHQGDMEDAKKNIDLAKQYGVPSHYRTYYVESQWYAQMLEKKCSGTEFSGAESHF